MVKPFSQGDKEIIRLKLLNKGMELLTIHGIRKVSVQDVTAAVGISKGAFYSFFPSKEEFFFEIFENVEKEVKKIFLKEIFFEGEDYKTSLKKFLKDVFAFMDTNGIYKLLNTEDMLYLIRNLPQEVISKHFSKDDEFAARFYEKYMKLGIFREMKPEVISGLMRALVFTKANEKEIGENVYPEVFDVLLDMVVNYFVKGE